MLSSFQDGMTPAHVHSVLTWVTEYYKQQNGSVSEQHAGGAAGLGVPQSPRAPSPKQRSAALAASKREAGALSEEAATEQKLMNGVWLEAHERLEHESMRARSLQAFGA